MRPSRALARDPDATAGYLHLFIESVVSGGGADSLNSDSALCDCTDLSRCYNSLTNRRSRWGGGSRWEARRVGKEGVSTCRYGWATYHENKIIKNARTVAPNSNK